MITFNTAINRCFCCLFVILLGLYTLGGYPLHSGRIKNVHIAVKVQVNRSASKPLACRLTLYMRVLYICIHFPRPQRCAVEYTMGVHTMGNGDFLFYRYKQGASVAKLYAVVSG